MARGQHGDAGNAAVGLEVMQVDVQQGGADLGDRLGQGLLHQGQIVEMLAAPQIDDQVQAGIAHAILADEMLVGGGRRRSGGHLVERSEEHTSELQSLMRISYAVFCLKKKNKKHSNHQRQNEYTNILNRIKNIKIMKN